MKEMHTLVFQKFTIYVSIEVLQKRAELNVFISFMNCFQFESVRRKLPL